MSLNLQCVTNAMWFLSVLGNMLFQREGGDIKEYKMWAPVAGDTS